LLVLLRAGIVSIDAIVVLTNAYSSSEVWSSAFSHLTFVLFWNISFLFLLLDSVVFIDVVSGPLPALSSLECVYAVGRLEDGIEAPKRN
jgi:hypothetical protein